MKTHARATLIASLLVVGMTIASADSPPAPLKHAKVGQLGEVLVGPTGMTLYTFANDKEPGKSACTGPCAENWPPFKPEPNAPAPKVPLSLIARDDGSKQYAYKGKPLYYWKNDKKASDATGHGVNQVWAVAKP